MKSVRAELLSSGWFGSVHASEFEAELTRRSTRRLSESSERVTPRVEPLGNLGTAMPSVGMRRTTRVFGVVKGADGARVLRSGRRLWPESGETKLRRPHDGDDWFSLLKSTGGKGGGGGGYDTNGWAHNAKPKRSTVVAEAELPKPKDDGCVALADGDGLDKMYGLVYRRKRKSLSAKSSEFLVSSEGQDGCDGKRFGRRFVRRQKRKLSSGESFSVSEDSDAQLGFTSREVISVVVVSSLVMNHCATRFLFSVLMYMTKASLRLTDLFAFLMSEPLSSVHTSSGIYTFLDHPSTKRFASCKLYGAMQGQPLFSVDFSAIPFCFTYMHSCLFFRYKSQPSLLRNDAIDTSDEIMSDDEEVQVSFSSGRDVTDCSAMINPESNYTENKGVSHPSVKASKLACRSTQYRNGLISRGIQKRRSSLRRRRARNPSLNCVQKPNGALVSDLVSLRKNAVSISVASNNKLRRSLRNSSVRNLKEVRQMTAELAQGSDSTSCFANMLVIGSEVCYRVGGAHVMLEMSPLGEWLIVVKKDGSTKFTHKAEKVMRNFSCNRFTHAMMWTGDNGWKLEFYDKKDWLIFKELYKECSDRNMPAPGVKIIPIPGVNEVSQDGYNHNNLFCRPDSYISVKDDEVSRAMAKKTPIYDIDSEDEEWLKRFNSELSAEKGLHEHVSEDNFELMVDTLEKAFFCSPFDISEEKKSTADLCCHLGGREVTEAVSVYWMKKRKQKRSSLLRVFQGHNNVKRASLIPRPSFRKKRSFKRQPSQVGRGKHASFLHAMLIEKDPMEEQNAMLKVEEAKISANKFMELAVLKRQRAQLLMNNADLATYKAAMALKIAQVAVDSDSLDSAAAHLLD